MMGKLEDRRKGTAVSVVSAQGISDICRVVGVGSSLVDLGQVADGCILFAIRIWRRRASGILGRIIDKM